MNLIKGLITGTFLLLMTWTISAQDLLKLVPKDASYAGMVNMQQIKTKGQLAELIKLPFLEKVDKQIAKEMSRDWVKADTGSYFDLTKYGINTTGKSFSYFKFGKEMMYGGVLLPITDKSKFEQLAKYMTRDLEGEKIKRGNGYTETSKRDLHIIWTNNTAFLFGAELNMFFKDSIEYMLKKKYKYEDNYLKEEIVILEEEVTEEGVAEEENKQMSWNEFYDLKRAYQDSIESEWLKANTKKLITGQGTNSMMNNTDFVNYLKSSPDAALVIDYGIISRYFTGYRYMYGMSHKERGIMGFLMGLYGDTKIFAKLDFEKDAAVMEIDSKYGKNLGEILKQIKKKKISRKFLKYLDKDLMGYYAFGMDVEGIGEGAKNMLRKSLPSLPEYGQAAVSGMELIEVFLDEKAIYNIFTGDGVVVFNDIKEFEIPYKTYDYDEDFNRKEVIDTLNKKLPELLIMAEIGNKADVQKIIDILVHSKVFKKDGAVYSLDIKRNKFPLYMRIADDILFVGNNKKFVQSPNALPKDKQLSKEHKKMFKKNSFAGFANVAQITRYFADAENSSFQTQKMLIESSNLFKDVKITGKKQGDFVHVNYTVNLSESTDNSLADIIKFINQLYIIKEKRM